MGQKDRVFGQEFHDYVMKLIPVLMRNISAWKEVKPLVLKDRDLAELIDCIKEDFGYML
jgi:hypothetical protein